MNQNVNPRRARVLVIEDEEMVCDLLEEVLSPLCEVTKVMQGEKALQILIQEGQAFDVIFCDLSMPKIGGLQIFNELRNKHPGNEKKIVFVTGGAVSPEAQAFVKNTTNQILYKPFSLQTVRDLVTQSIK